MNIPQAAPINPRAPRIHSSARPMHDCAPIQPMSDEDVEWSLKLWNAKQPKQPWWQRLFTKGQKT